MASTILHIKNMVCDRCIKVVNDELTKMGYSIKSIELGEVNLEDSLDRSDLDRIRQILTENGFELIDDRKSQLINRIKTLIIEFIHYDREKPEHVNLSDFLAKELGHDYSYLSNLFSSVEVVTIEKYLILQKIEKVKELLVYNELSLNEISYQLGYSSVQHLSNQFKKITGLTPSHFKEIGKDRRNPLDKV
jgi:YesN/AraC family two-component response regulator